MLHSFYEEAAKYRNFDFARFLSQVKSKDIEEILNKESLSIFDFLSLLSPEAVFYLEALAQNANRISLANFGRVISLYAPLYLSNYCENECAYCGFKHSNAISRRKLSSAELKREAQEISKTGIRHILILSGESRAESPLSYIKECVELLKEYFTSIFIEIYPLNVAEYTQLFNSGVDGLTIYQETYDKALYATLHSRGPKRDYIFRLGAPERALEAGLRQVNLGALLGLADFRKDSFFTALHAKWLEDNYPAAEIGVSFPRIQPQAGNFFPLHPLGDKDLAQLVIAMRLFLARVAITISTRENNILRKNLIGLGVTRISAGSRTEVGGYALCAKSEGQFEIADKSSVDEVRDMVYKKGYQPIFKDWQRI